MKNIHFLMIICIDSSMLRDKIYGIKMSIDFILRYKSIDVVSGVKSSGPEHVNTSPETEPDTDNGGCSLSQRVSV